MLKLRGWALSWSGQRSAFMLEEARGPKAYPRPKGWYLERLPLQVGLHLLQG